MSGANAVGVGSSGARAGGHSRDRRARAAACRTHARLTVGSNGQRYSRIVRVLSVTHGPSVPGGVFDETVVASGHELDRWVVPLGRSPQPASSYDAVMVFGGSMHPDQDDHFSWLAREEEFLHEVLHEEIPAFGVCLGAQMLARAAGAKVGPASEPEIGWLDVELTPDGVSDSVLGVLPARTTVFQWHHYTFELPRTGSSSREATCACRRSVSGVRGGSSSTQK